MVVTEDPKWTKALARGARRDITIVAHVQTVNDLGMVTILQNRRESRIDANASRELDEDCFFSSELLQAVLVKSAAKDSFLLYNYMYK
jgi:hypothetical protein